ncbi:MAG: KTSC domain-containing protein [Candidatus Kapaibacteriota bacterium]
MAKSTSKSQQFEDLYPAISEWIDTTGWIEFGKNDMSHSMARVLDEGGMLWEGKSSYSSINALFADVEQAVKKELGYDEDKAAEIIAPKTTKKAVESKAKASKIATQKTTSVPDENIFLTVESSMIAAVRYNARTKELDVLYNSGKVWCYSGVDKEEYEGLMKSSSKGSYMRSNIIGCYPETPIKLGRK